MDWNYVGIDDDPPKGQKVILLYPDDYVGYSHFNKDAVAWASMNGDALKRECQHLLEGLPELKMVGLICKNPDLKNELASAVVYYCLEPENFGLNVLVDLIRVLNKRAAIEPLLSATRR